MKRIIALMLSVLLLSALGSVFAAEPGSPQDPLLSRSYVRQWQQLLLDDRAAQAEQAAQALVTDGARALEMLRGRCGENGMRTVALAKGARVLLSAGDSFTLLSGSGSFAVQSGQLIDVTAGEVLSPGKAAKAHRYIADRETEAVFTALSKSKALLTGAAVVSQYTDSAPGQWYGSAVDYAAARELMNGTGDGMFSPDATLTRAMFVTILGRMAGVSTKEYTGSTFSDVEKGSWYAPYVQWGAKKGIVNGVGDGKFDPNSPVTREQMAALITRFADSRGYTLPRGVSVRAAFADAGSISGWAFESVDRMRTTGLLNGDEYGNFNPLKGATRAEAATVFMRLDATIRLL